MIAFRTLVITPSGTEYAVKVRTGLAGSHTWSGTPDWGVWGAAHKFKTSGEARNGAGSSSAQAGKASKKKKNRDAGFAAMLSKRSDAGQEQDGEEGEGESSRGDCCRCGRVTLAVTLGTFWVDVAAYEQLLQAQHLTEISVAWASAACLAAVADLAAAS